MPRFLRPALILAAISAVCFLISFYFTGAAAYLAVGFATGVSAAVFLIITVVTLIQRSTGKRETSPWKLFAIGTALLIAAAVAIGVIDNGDHPEKLGDGWLGAICLYYGVPILAALLIFELIVWKIKQSFDEAEESPAPQQTQPEQKPRPARIVVEERSEPVVRPAVQPKQEASDFSQTPSEAFSLGALPPPDSRGDGK